MQVEVEYIPIEDEETLQRHRLELKLMSNFLPYSITEDNYLEFLRERLGTVVLLRTLGIPFCVFCVEPFKKSAEIHGVFRPDLNQIVPDSKGLKANIIQEVFNFIFYELNKKTLVMKAIPEAKGVRGLALMYGFTKLKNTDKGRNVFVLSRNNYEEKLEKILKN